MGREALLAGCCLRCVGALAIAGLLIAAAPAAAADYYVSKSGADSMNTTCSQGSPCLTIQHAVGLLLVGDGDTIHIGPGNYAESVFITDDRLSLVGSGPGTFGAFNMAGDTFGTFDQTMDTRIKSTNASASINMADGGSLSNLRIEGTTETMSVQNSDAITLLAGSGGGARSYTLSNVIAVGGLDKVAPPVGKSALFVTDTTDVGHAIDVNATGSQFVTGQEGETVRADGANVALTLVGATVAPSTVDPGLHILNGAEATLDRSAIVDTINDNNNGIRVQDSGSHLALVRSSVVARSAPVLVGSGGASAEITDSLVALLSTPALLGGNQAALFVADNTTPIDTATVRGSTLVARAPGADAAVFVAGAPGFAGGGQVTVTNTVIRATDTDGVSPFASDVVADRNDGIATFAANNSAFTTLDLQDGATGTAPGSGANVVGDPLFVNDAVDAARDFSLQNGSPLIDRGDPAIVAAGQLDLPGNPRSLDSNMDCLAAPEIGAYEKTGLSAPCPPAAAGPPAAGPPAGGAVVEPSPVLSALSFSNPTFRVGGASITARRKAKKGTRIRFKLDKAARATATIEQALPGRRVGKRCLAPTRARRRKPRCTRYSFRGSFSFAAVRGSNSVTWSGHLRRRIRGRLRRVALPPARYRLRLVARDAAGKASRERSAGFTIVRR